MTMDIKPPDKTLDEVLAPSAVSLGANDMQIGEKYARTIFVATYPRYLNTGWLAPVINLDKEFDMAFFIHPENSAEVLKKLRDQLGRLEAEAMEEQSAGKVRNPILETGIRDIESLRDALQQGTEKFYRVGLYITLYGKDRKG